MSMESDLVILLKSICPLVFPDVANSGIDRPYITWQSIGGDAWRYGDGAAPDKRMTAMQINAWATTRADAISLIHAVESAIDGVASWQVEPQGEAVSRHEPANNLYGSTQLFLIWAPR